MKYDISKKSAPAMPNLGNGTECIKILLSQASKVIQEPLVLMLYPVVSSNQVVVKFGGWIPKWSKTYLNLTYIVTPSR